MSAKVYRAAQRGASPTLRSRGKEVCPSVGSGIADSSFRLHNQQKRPQTVSAYPRETVQGKQSNCTFKKLAALSTTPTMQSRSRLPCDLAHTLRHVAKCMPYSAPPHL